MWSISTYSVWLFLAVFLIASVPSLAQDKTHTKKLEKVKNQPKRRKKKDKGIQIPGKN